MALSDELGETDQASNAHGGTLTLTTKQSWLGSIKSAIHHGAITAKSAVDSIRVRKDIVHEDNKPDLPRKSTDTAASENATPKPNQRPTRRHTLATRSAVSSLRSHLPHRSKSTKTKRGSISSVFGRSDSVKATANSARGPETFAAEETILSQDAEDKDAAKEPAEDDEASLIPLPSSPIKIPVPTLSLRTDFDSPAQFPRFDTAEAEEASMRALQDPANTTTGLPVPHLLGLSEEPIGSGKQLMSEALSPTTSPSRKTVTFSSFPPFSSSPVRQESYGRSSPMPGTTAQLELESGPSEALPEVRPLTSLEISLYDRYEIHNLRDQKAGVDGAISSLFLSHPLDTEYRPRSPHTTATMVKRPRSPEPAAGFTLEHHNIDTAFDAAASFGMMGEHDLDSALEDCDNTRKRYKTSSSRESSDRIYEDGIGAGLNLEQDMYYDRAFPQGVPRGKTCASLTEAEREILHAIRMANIKAGAKESEQIIAKTDHAWKIGGGMHANKGKQAARSSSIGSQSDGSSASGSVASSTLTVPRGKAQRKLSAKIDPAEALKKEKVEAARQSLENDHWPTGYSRDLHGSRFKPGDAYGLQHSPGRGETGVWPNGAVSSSRPMAKENNHVSSRDRKDAILGVTRARPGSSSDELTLMDSTSHGAGSRGSRHSTPSTELPVHDLTTGVESPNDGPAAPPRTFQLAVRTKKNQSSTVQERYFPGTHVVAAESAPSQRQSSSNSDLDSIPSTQTDRKESGNGTS